MSEKILLVCGAGASSGFMEAAARKAVKKMELDYEIKAHSEPELAYLHMGKMITSKLLESFAQDIRITNVYEEFSQIKDLAEVDLVLTTFGEQEIPDELRQNDGIVTIKEFVTSSDVNKLRLKIELIYQEKYRQFLWQTLPDWIAEDFYLQLTQDLDREMIFEKLWWIFREGIC